jgi:penicillin-binding protein 1A
MNSPKRSKRKHPVLRVLSIFALATLCTVVIGVSATYIYLDPQIPEASTFRNVTLEAPLRIYAKDGELIGEFGERRLIPIALEDVPQDFINAILDTEDKRFYQHSGIDYISLANDVLQLAASLAGIGNERLGGASTITMQLARNVSFTLERSFLRKFKEMLLSLKIEQELSKDEILELYINLVPFGKRAYGAEAAAVTYYGKSLNQLTLAQLAMLAGTPQRPEAGNPINGPEWALRRRNQVLGRMISQQSITAAQYIEAVAAPITAKVYARELDLPSPYVAEWARQQVTGLVPDLYTGGYEIYTTLDGAQQWAAMQALRNGLLKYDQDHGYRGPEGRVSPALLTDLNQTFGTVGEQQDTSLDAPQQLGSATPPDSNTSEIEKATQVVANIKAELESFTAFDQQTPAVIVALTDDNAEFVTKDGDGGSLTLEASKWARAYLSVDELGPRPQRMTDILAVGDIVRVNVQPSEQQQPTWLLTQLPEIQGALIAMDPNDGAIRALMGGYDFYRNQYNYALQAQRQPGSGFKPFVYSSALGRGITPADIFLDAPLVFEDANLESQYRPENDNNRYNGPTRLREALYRSINLVSMRVLLKIGAGRVLRDVRKFGFDMTSFPRNTQLALGGGTMTVAPVDMARAYAVLANGGYLVEPYIVDRLVDQQGNVLFAATPARVCPSCQDPQAEAEKERLSTNITEPTEEPKMDWLGSTIFDKLLADAESAKPKETSVLLAQRVLDERNAFIMQSMLRDVIKLGTGRRARALGRNDLAGKTGTTNDASDTWFNGFNSSLVASVWVGFKDQEPLGRNAYGSNIPLPIWIDFMREALDGVPERVLPQPPGVVNLRVDRETGQPTYPSNSSALDEVFLAEFAPDPAPTVDKGNVSGEEIRAVDLF